MTGAVEWLIGTVWFHWKYLSPPLGGPGSLLKLPAMQAGDDPVNNSSNLPEQQKTSEKSSLPLLSLYCLWIATRKKKHLFTWKIPPRNPHEFPCFLAITTDFFPDFIHHNSQPWTSCSQPESCSCRMGMFEITCKFTHNPKQNGEVFDHVH